MGFEVDTFYLQKGEKEPCCIVRCDGTKCRIQRILDNKFWSTDADTVI